MKYTKADFDLLLDNKCPHCSKELIVIYDSLSRRINQCPDKHITESLKKANDKEREAISNK